MTAEELARVALGLVIHDGEWPSPESEDGPQATRAAAMQAAINNLARAVLLLSAALADAQKGQSK